MKQIALAHNLPVLQPESINTPEGIVALKLFLALILARCRCVWARFSSPRRIERTAPLGGINVHASLLPKYRARRRSLGPSITAKRRSASPSSRCRSRLDAGDMLAQEAIALDPQETAGEAEARLAVLGAKLTLDILRQMDAGTVQGRKQDQALVTKAPKLTKEHGSIDWTRPAAAVCHQVRAMQPWPTAYTWWHRAGQPALRLIVCRVSARSMTENEKGEPGELLQPHGDFARLRVATGGRTVVEIHKLQPAGKRRMTADDFLRGRRPQLGDRLGPEQA